MNSSGILNNPKNSLEFQRILLNCYGAVRISKATTKSSQPGGCTKGFTLQHEARRRAPKKPRATTSCAGRARQVGKSVRARQERSQQKCSSARTRSPQVQEKLQQQHLAEAPAVPAQAGPQSATATTPTKNRE